MAGHVGAAAWWVGCLWILLRVSRVQDPAPFALLVRRFSNQAVWVVGGLVIAGATAAALLLNFTFEFARDYDRGLALKVGLALLLFQVALFNKFELTPGLITRATAQPALGRSIIGELALVACILAATASLTTFASPHEQAAAPREVIAVSGPIDIIDPWAAATPGGVTTGGGYLSIVQPNKCARPMTCDQTDQGAHNRIGDPPADFRVGARIALFRRSGAPGR